MNTLRRARFALAMRLRTDIYHVTEKANWALYWVGHYVTQHLQAAGRRAHLVDGVGPLRGQIIHYGAREMFLNRPPDHPSNHVFLTWFHGKPDDPDPALRALFEKLPARSPELRRIVTSCAASRAALLAVGVPPAQIEVIPIGVDLAHFTPPDAAARQAARAALGIPPEAFVVASFQKDGTGWGAGDAPKLIKGPDVLLDTLARLAPHYPQIFVLLTGPARGYVKNGLDKLGVRYMHHMLDDYAQMPRFYYASDAYLITSRSEGGPKGLMESWATGVPVVSTAMGMPADWVRHGENGLLAPVEDAPALAEALARLIEEPALRERFRTAGYGAVKPLDWARIAADYDRLLYAPLVDKR